MEENRVDTVFCQKSFIFSFRLHSRSPNSRIKRNPAIGAGNRRPAKKMGKKEGEKRLRRLLTEEEVKKGTSCLIKSVG